MDKEIKVNADETLEIVETKTEVKTETTDLGHLRTLLEAKKFDKEKTLAERQALIDAYADSEAKFDAQIAAMEAEITQVEKEVAELNNFATYEKYKAYKEEKLIEEEEEIIP